MQLIFIHSFTLIYTIHAISLFIEGSIHQLTETLTVLFTCYAMLVKTFWLISKIETIQNMLKTVKTLLENSSFGRVGTRPTLDAKILRLTKFSNIYYASSYLTVTVASLVSVVRYKERILPYETLAIWDYKKIDGWFWTLELYQFLFGLHGVSLGCSFDIMTVAFLGLTGKLLDELSMEIDFLKECKNDEERLKKLEKCIKIHIEIKSFAKDITKHLSFFYFVQALMSTVILCTSVFILTSVIFVEFFFYSWNNFATFFLLAFLDK